MFADSAYLEWEKLNYFEKASSRSCKRTMKLLTKIIISQRSEEVLGFSMSVTPNHLQLQKGLQYTPTFKLHNLLEITM